MYLLKFGTLFIDLPHQQPLHSFQYVTGHKEYCNRLLHYHELFGRVQNSQHLADSMGVLAKHFDLTLREIEKVFTGLTLYYGSVPDNQVADPFLVATLSVLKVKRRSLYQQLSKQAISAKEFFEQTQLNQIGIGGEDSFSLEWHRDFLDFCLISDDEFRGAVQQGSAGYRGGLVGFANQYRGDRHRIIPALCGRLDRFSPLLSKRDR